MSTGHVAQKGTAMPDSHLIPDGTSPNQNFTETVRTTQGNRFTVASSTMLNAVRWHRFNTSTVKPNTLYLWLVSTGQQIAVIPPNDLGTVGWQTNAITPIQLFPGVTYCIGADNPVGQTRGQWVPHATPDTGITWIGSYWLNNTGGGNANPTTNQGDVEFPYDIVCSPPPATPSDTTILADVDYAFVDYLGEDADTRHPASLPAVDHGTLNSVATKFGNLTDVGATSLFGKINGAVATLASIASLVSYAQDHWGDITSGFSSVLSRIGTPTGSLTDLLNDANDALATGFGVTNGKLDALDSGGGSFTADVIAGRSGFPSGTPNTAWTLVDTVDFDTQLAWTVAADLYVVSITAVRPGIGADSFAGLTWYHRLGTWCVLNGSLGSTRRFVEFEHQVLEDNGRRMAGLAMRCQPGTIGTVQAWTLAPIGG